MSLKQGMRDGEWGMGNSKLTLTFVTDKLRPKTPGPPIWRVTPVSYHMASYKILKIQVGMLFMSIVDRKTTHRIPSALANHREL